MKYLFILAILGGAAFFFATTYKNKFNDFRSRANEAMRRLEVAIRERFDLLKKLDSAMGAEQSIGKSAVGSALKTGERTMFSENLTEKGMALGETNQHLERAFLQLRNPNLTQLSPKVGIILDQIEENTRKINLAKREYNSYVKEHNRLMESGTAGFVATIMKIDPMVYFRGAEDRMGEL